MKITMVYVAPLCAGDKYIQYAFRFLCSYHECPPGEDHDTVVVLNGGKANSEITCMFSRLPNCIFLEHDNSGFDIGAYQLAASVIPSDLMVFLGVSTYFKGHGWMKRIAQSVNKHGNALYGVMGNMGDKRVNVFPHLRTTGFWMAPSLLNAYPLKVKNHPQRYEFEHGKNCLAEWVHRKGLKRLVVTWTGEYHWAQWDSIPNGFHRGNQSALLMGDHLSEPPYYHTA